MKLRIHNKKVFSSSLFFFTVIGLITFYFIKSHHSENNAHESSEFAKKAWVQFKNTKPIVFSKDLGFSIVKNEANAKLELLLFFDFNCDQCIPRLEQLKKISEKNNYNLKLRPYPLSHECNSSVITKGEYYSCYYAQFLICVDQQKTNVYDAILQIGKLNTPEKKRNALEDLTAVAGVMKLNSEELNACMKDPGWVRLKQKITDDHFKNQSVTLPQLIINNKVFLGSHSDAALEYFFEQLKLEN